MWVLVHMCLLVCVWGWGGAVNWILGHGKWKWTAWPHRAIFVLPSISQSFACSLSCGFLSPPPSPQLSSLFSLPVISPFLLMSNISDISVAISDQSNQFTLSISHLLCTSHTSILDCGYSHCPEGMTVILHLRGYYSSAPLRLPKCSFYKSQSKIISAILSYIISTHSLLNVLQNSASKSLIFCLSYIYCIIFSDVVSFLYYIFALNWSRTVVMPLGIILWKILQ